MVTDEDEIQVMIFQKSKPMSNYESRSSSFSCSFLFEAIVSWIPALSLQAM